MNTLEYLKVSEVAEICRVERRAVLDWIHKNKLPAIKLPGGHYLINKLDVPTFKRSKKDGKK